MKNRPPIVSIVIPTHNRERLLARLLKSLDAQTYPHDAVEILIINNVGTDNTADAVAHFSSNSEIAVAYHQTNFPNPMLSRALGTSLAKGSIIAFIDDDCVATPSWLAEGVQALATGAGGVQGRTIPYPGQLRKFIEKTIDIPEATPYFETCNMLYTKEAYDRAGGFSEEFAAQRTYCGDDTDLGWKIKKLGYEIVFCPTALVYHEVFSVSPWKWLIEARRMFIWPYLVKKHPELRHHMYRRYFLHRRTALFDIFVLGLIAGLLIHPLAFAFTAPYFAYRLVEPAPGKSFPARIVRVIAGLPRACVFLGALAIGCARYRSFLL